MLYHMRTTFLIADDVYRQVKVLAAQEDRTVTSLVEQALQKMLDEHDADQVAAPEPFRFKPMGNGGLRPGVDADRFAGMADDDEVERYLRVMAQA